MLIGRDDESGAIYQALDAAAGERGGALVLRGEAGIGKSTLLDFAVTEATNRGMTVVSTAGVQAEVDVPYAGLHRLLRGSEVGRRAIEAPDVPPLRVAVTILELFSEADSPTLVAVEDAHWLDKSTWDVLTFVARRIHSDPVLMLMTAREGAVLDQRIVAAGLPELPVGPLSTDAAGALLHRIAPDLPAALRDRVLDESAGNPLGIVELGRAATRSGAGALLPSTLPLSTRLERTFDALVAELPAPTRTLLLVAALNDGDSLDETLAASGKIDASAMEPGGAPATADDVAPALDARLVRVDESFRLSFRHSLLRSAIAGGATPARRRAAHAALAEVITAEPDRRVWHRAAAATKPDEKLAAELAEMAIRAGRRQAASTAVAALERAAALSEDPHQRSSRMLSAAEMAAEQGDAVTVRQLLLEVESRHLRPSEQARLSWARETFLESGWSGTSKLASYAQIIDTMRRDGDVTLAMDSLLSISVRFFWSGADPQTRALYLTTAERMDVPDLDPRLVATIAVVAPETHGAVALDRMRRLRERVDVSPTEQHWLGFAASVLGDHGLALEFLAGAASGVRPQGRLGVLAQVLLVQAFSASYQCDTEAALTAATEARTLAAETGQVLWAVAADMARGARRRCAATGRRPGSWRTPPRARCSRPGCSRSCRWCSTSGASTRSSTAATRMPTSTCGVASIRPIRCSTRRCGSSSSASWPRPDSAAGARPRSAR
ncbi:AAA family ATPase [Asanoa iriomotensis]|uniref:Orc1-like AAA ATPase domain-containing protein n=1 Tax=Asanoa iriomotensis TaxID=234613 RepID=A0ABQ4C037_9ACTN|nr:AAA family ATPase [Asanoa iriomotensis]GIF55781.1 hypothetical protein Air01nite_18760 [Asanoa iriomotensis]